MHADAPHATGGGEFDHRGNLPLVAVHAAWRQEPQHVQRVPALARGVGRRDQHRIGGELAGRDRVVDAREVLVDDAAGADVEMPDFRVAHLALGRPTCSSDASIVVCGAVARRPVQCGIAACAIALSGAASRLPKPSRISSTTGRTAGSRVRAGAAAGAAMAAGMRRRGRAGAGADRVSFYALPFTGLPRMPFIEKNWMLILVMFLSGAMLLWPILQRRFSPVKEVGNLNVTHLINHKDAVLLDVREPPSSRGGGKLPNALHIPLSQLNARAGELGKLTSRRSSSTAREATAAGPRATPCKARIRRHLFAARRDQGVEGRGPAARSGMTPTISRGRTRERRQ